MTPLILTVDQSMMPLLFSTGLESWQVSLGMFHSKSREARTGKPSSAFSSSSHTLLVAVPVAGSRPVQSQCEQDRGTGSCENTSPLLHLEDPAVFHKAVKSGYGTPSRGTCPVKGTPQNREDGVLTHLLHEPERLV